MRVLWLLAAWSVLAVIATMCFAVGGSLGYRRGVRDAVAQLRDRRSGKTGCRPLPANHLRRRTSGYSRPGARARRARWPSARQVPRPARSAPRRPLTTAAAASVAAILLIGVPGTAIGATTARPGESLWKVKLGLERVRLAVAAGPTRDAEAHVDLASARLSELAGLVGTDASADVVGEVSDDLGAHARAANDALPDVATTEVRDELQRRLTDVTEKQAVVMGTLLGVDCGAQADTDCAALADSDEGTAESGGADEETVALAVPLEPETDTTSVTEADADATAPARSEGDGSDATGSNAAEAPPPQTDADEPTSAASEPVAAGTPTPTPTSAPTPTSEPTPTPSVSEAPSESPTPMPSPSPSGPSGGPVAGSPATEGPTTAPAPADNTTPDALEAQLN